MNFKSIQERLLEGNLYGDEVASYRNYIAVMLARAYEKYAGSLSFRAEWTTEHRAEYKSQAECERAWEATGPGKEETTLKWTIKAYEALSEVLTSLWFQLNKEERSAQGL
jgi:hypothetical protein